MLTLQRSLNPKLKNKAKFAHSSTKRAVLRENLPAFAYTPEIVEKNKYAQWEQNGLFTPENCGEKRIFSMVLPPPNITGTLHLGHALACTIQDVIVRVKRSRGYNVLWIPGTDHAGIATQGVVEKYLKSNHNINRQDIGRDNFNSEVWKWKEKYGNNICQQLRTLGCSLDWQRQIFTMDPRHTDAVNTAFIHLFKKGLLYRKKALVNWCNKLKSTVSDIEVENLTINCPTDIPISGYEEPIKFGLIYDFAYRIADTNEEIVVSTTMPETMLGDTAIAVHPNDNRYRHLRGKRAVHPFRDSTIPIIFDEMVDIDFGTGAVKITPAHSKIDYAIAMDHNLPLLQVIDENGLIMNSKQFNKMKRYECRKEIVKALQDIGLLKKISPNQMSLPICSRTGDVIEHLPKEQWFLACSELNSKANELVESKKLRIEPDKFVNNWLNWTGDDRDWCISRQLWWGHQIPAYKCVAEDNIIWIAAKDEVSAKMEAFKLLKTDRVHLERDMDVLDTWFSSGIYPFAALGWPECNNLDYQKFYPLSLMATGHDILGFWVHRMVILGLELTGSLPFNNVLLHGIICDNKGAKMSKSKGNVIDPVDVINGASLDKLKDKAELMFKNGILNRGELQKALAYHKSYFSKNKGIPECGVDALRFTLLSHDIKSHLVNFDIEICHSNKLFCNKIWQSVKYLQLSMVKLPTTTDDIIIEHLTFFDRWILSRLASMVQIFNTSIDAYDFHLTTKAIRSFIYNDFCDVYLEATKPGFENTASVTGFAHAHTLSAALNVSLRCLAPFMIHLTEEIIPKIPSFEKNIVYNFHDGNKRYFELPRTEDFRKWLNNDLENQADYILRLINLVRQLKGLFGISNKIKSCVCIETTNNDFKSDIDNNKHIILHLTRCGRIVFDKDCSKRYVTGILDKDTKVNLELIGENVDGLILEAKQKLEKKINKIMENLSKLEIKYESDYYVRNVSEATKMTDKEVLLKKKEELKHLKRMIT